ncbi:transposase [Picosynechococcus sp. PCC 7003]|uniref:Tn3 family transposase n=1 Tax=Picosynechococcus sp. PCC 7003 TaxID=374981 RepID=UPI000810975D|nr:Tn3 family transposase [Picosynechococcus sp. PCC 7003]ANV84116.1 transposase [Picosynechococcus sp. PCC 7003]
MTVIERTAYPKISRTPSTKELEERYRPTEEELAWARPHVRTQAGLLSWLVTLKIFQATHYFPAPKDVPKRVIRYIRSHLKLPASLSGMPAKRSWRLYQEQIRGHLNIVSYRPQGEQLAITVVEKLALIRDDPADLINGALEELSERGFELPAFSTLDRLVRHVRAATNQKLWEQLADSLSADDCAYLDRLIHTEEATDEAMENQDPQGDTPEKLPVTLNLLKASPKRPSLSHLWELQNTLERLMGFGDAQEKLKDIAPAKAKAFAAQARALDAGEFKDMRLPKRRSLLLCLLHRAQVKTRDHLADMFVQRMGKIHNAAKQRLLELREQHLRQTEIMLGIFAEVLAESADNAEDEAQLGKAVQAILNTHGGTTNLLTQCKELTTYNTNNHLPLAWQFYSRHRKAMFDLLRLLELRPTSAEQSLFTALEFLQTYEDKRAAYLPAELELNFISENWRKLVVVERDEETVLVRQQLEVCLFSYLATELKTGDICVMGSESYADFREQLLPWEECQNLLAEYSQETGIPNTAEAFVEQLKSQLSQVAAAVDTICKDGTQVTISKEGKPVLKRLKAAPSSPSALRLEHTIHQRLPERSVLDILCNVQHWVNWTRHFGPLSGSEPKLDEPVERYIFTTFGYGCNLGPNETARHTRGLLSAHQLSYIHSRHISTEKIEDAIRDIIQAYSQLKLPNCWGTGKRAAADGSKFEVYDNNLMAEYHLRYKGYGGIAYHHVCDNYIALFTHFISCGVWEAVYILDGLLKNTSALQPDTLHADTQGQSTPVFALAHLLGIELMPRIRSWQDYSFFRPDSEVVYDYIDPLFTDVAQWGLIQTHWQDLMRVVLSIRAGKLMPSTILRKLGSYSRKNRLYQAFKALGQVIRTLFLLRYISERHLRRQINDCTNKVESFHRFLDWLFFGKEGVITENDADAQEKQLKYLELVSAAVILHNAVDISQVIRELCTQGYTVTPEDVAIMSPYLTKNLRRYGDFVADLGQTPPALEEAFSLPFIIPDDFAL